MRTCSGRASAGPQVVWEVALVLEAAAVVCAFGLQGGGGGTEPRVATYKILALYVGCKKLYGGLLDKFTIEPFHS